MFVTLELRGVKEAQSEHFHTEAFKQSKEIPLTG